MKLKAFLFEEVQLPKNKLIEYSKGDPELYELEDQLIELIGEAYSQVGGHGNFHSINQFDNIFVADTDGDNKINIALLAAKTRNGSTKLSIFATDGSAGAKSMLMSSVKDILSRENFWAEIPYQFASFLYSRGVNMLTSEEQVRMLLGGRIWKSFEWIGEKEGSNGNGYYTRNFFGKDDIRAIMGNIPEQTFTKIKDFITTKFLDK